MLTPAPSGLLNAYRMNERREPSSDDVELLLTEGWVRVRQALYALARFREIELRPNHRAEVSYSELPSRAAAIPRHDAGAPELEFYAEAFYQVAFRAREVLKQVPRFSRLDAKGVRRVRNQLIQHAEKPDGRLQRNYAWDDARGFSIKPYGLHPALGEHWLYVDAEEFVRKLLERLESATPDADAGEKSG